MRILLAGISVAAYADLPTGLIGGQALDGSAYAAQVFYPSGAVPSVSGLPGATSQIYGVSINQLGVGLIGGLDSDSNGYAAFVSPSGIRNQLAISFPGGTIISTSINQTGFGLIGGAESGSVGVAALIAPDGTVTPLTFVTDIIVSVALNNAGVGLIGGEGGRRSACLCSLCCTRWHGH